MVTLWIRRPSLACPPCSLLHLGYPIELAPIRHQKQMKVAFAFPKDELLCCRVNTWGIPISHQPSSRLINLKRSIARPYLLNWHQAITDR